MKNQIVVCLILCLAVIVIGAPKNQQPNFYAPINTPAYAIHHPGDFVRKSDNSFTRPYTLPQRDDFIGERILAGDTWYDYQSNGSIGKMIAMDPEGGIHITWMDGDGADMNNSARNMKYNYYHDDTFEWEDGANINSDQRGGYGSIAISTLDDFRPIAFYHAGTGDNVRAYCGIDFMMGVGAFAFTPLPRYPDQSAIWPQGIMSPQRRVHAVYNRRDSGMISYASGPLNRNEEPVFGDNPIAVAQTHLNTYRIARSPVSEKVAITWLTSRAGIPAPELWDGFLAYQMYNDLMLVWSDDGINWNFNDPVNVTNNKPPDPQLEGDRAYGDTLFAFNNHDVIIDHNDNIHIVFDVRSLKVQPIPESSPPIDGLTIDAGFLFHWSEETNEKSAVADGWFTHRELNDEGEIINWPTPGAWKTNVCNPSLGFDSNGDLYCVFNYYPLNDYSQENYCNGDISVTVSEDNGRSWYMPTRITETRSHLAEEYGQSLCEVYPSLAETVDDFLHISYELDTEPGSLIQDYPNRVEVSSLCYWYYHRLPVELVERNEIYEGPSFHIADAPLVSNVKRAQDTPEPEQDVTITATIRGIGVEIQSAQVEYSVDGGRFLSVDLERIEADAYRGIIPAQEEGTNVWYRIRAIDREHQETVVPAGWWYSYWVKSEGALTIHDIQFHNREWPVDYSPYMDYRVTVTGVITTPLSFARTYGAYAIQDEETFWSGIFLRGIDADLNVGEIIQVSGTVRERDTNDPQRWRYQTFIEVDEWEVLGETDPVSPIQVSIADLRFATHAEELEGVLIEIDELEVNNIDYNDNLRHHYLPIIDSESGDEAWMTSYGLSEEIKAEIEYNTFTQGTIISNLRGVFSENQRYAIAPRSADDFGQVPVPNVEESSVPRKLTLSAPYPNPFNNITTLSFSLPHEGWAKLALYDLNGKLVETIKEGYSRAGRQIMNYNATHLASGIYLLRLQTQSQTLNTKMILIK